MSTVITALLLATAHAASPLIFIVGRENPVTSLSRADLANLFLKKQTRWPDGTPVRFIDWREGSAARSEFLEQIVGKSSRDVELYWIGQKLQSGDSAPLRVSSDSMVVRFVERFKGAIGYVLSPHALDDAPVKRIEVTEAR